MIWFILWTVVMLGVGAWAMHQILEHNKREKQKHYISNILRQKL